MDGRSGNDGNVGSGGIPNGIAGIGIASESRGGVGILHLLVIFHATKTFSDSSLYSIGGGNGPGPVIEPGAGTTTVC